MCEILLAVVVIITQLIHLQQAAHIHIGRFAVPIRSVKQIGERFRSAHIRIQLRVPVIAQLVLDNSSARVCCRVRPRVHIVWLRFKVSLISPHACSKLQNMAGIDTEVFITCRVGDIFSIARIGPVVKQVDRRAKRGQALHGVCAQRLIIHNPRGRSLPGNRKGGKAADCEGQVYRRAVRCSRFRRCRIQGHQRDGGPRVILCLGLNGGIHNFGRQGFALFGKVHQGQGIGVGVGRQGAGGQLDRNLHIARRLNRFAFQRKPDIQRQETIVLAHFLQGAFQPGQGIGVGQHAGFQPGAGGQHAFSRLHGDLGAVLHHLAGIKRRGRFRRSRGKRHRRLHRRVFLLRFRGGLRRGVCRGGRRRGGLFRRVRGRGWLRFNSGGFAGSRVLGRVLRRKVIRCGFRGCHAGQIGCECRSRQAARHAYRQQRAEYTFFHLLIQLL